MPRRKVSVSLEGLPYFGLAEVAEVLGWERAKVATYHGRKRLPEPAFVLAAGPVWARADIERFAREQGLGSSSAEGAPAVADYLDGRYPQLMAHMPSIRLTVVQER